MKSMGIMKTVRAYAAIAVAVAVFSGCSETNVPTATQEVLTPVEVTVLSPGDIKKELIYAGQVSAAESVNVISKVTGKVLTTYFDVGDEVKVGDVLFKLDEKDIKDQQRQVEAQIAQAEQGIKTAENAVKTATGGQYQSQVLQQETSIENYSKQLENALIVLENAKTAISNAETGVENARKAFENTASQFESTKILYGSGLVAQNDYDRAELGYEQAEAAYTQAEAALKQAQNGYAQAQISYETLTMVQDRAKEGLSLTTSTVAEDNKRQAQLAVESAKAGRDILMIQKELIENTLKDTAVTSPISGIISGRNAKENEYVSNQAPAYTIVNIGSVYVDVKVSELIINNLHPGDEVDVILSALGSDAVKGKIYTVSPTADGTGTFPVKIEIENASGLLKPGMFAEIHFIKEQSSGALVLPRNTVLSDENISYVYVESGGYSVKTPVTVGIDNGRDIEIISGLKAGDRVITKGQSYVADNEKLNIVAVLED